jgi:hypothetical protein
MRHEIFTINNVNDKKEILDTLSGLYTDEDFSGNNGEEFTWNIALENGFNSSQEYVIDVLKNSGLEGEALIEAFFHQWLDKDDYYGEWTLETAEVGDTLVVSYAIVENDL